MSNEVMTEAEAWEEVERRKISLSWSQDDAEWFATVFEPIVVVGSGGTLFHAIADLLQWIPRAHANRAYVAQFLQRPGYQNGMKAIEEMEAGRGSIGR